MDPFATAAEEHRNLVRALDDFGFNDVFLLRYRYQHEGDDEFARNSYQPDADGPVCGRIYEVNEDKWSSESTTTRCSAPCMVNSLHGCPTPRIERGHQKQYPMPILVQL